jgi:hypothetical protein
MGSHYIYTSRPQLGTPALPPKKKRQLPEIILLRKGSATPFPFTFPFLASAFPFRFSLGKAVLVRTRLPPSPSRNHARCANTLPTICSPPNPWRCLQEPLHRQRSYEPQCAAGRSPAPLAGLQPRQQVCSASHVHGSTHPWIYLCFSFPCLDRDKLSG